MVKKRKKKNNNLESNNIESTSNNAFISKVEELKKPNSILVIGNGFDLACKLNSRFSDFIGYIEKTKGPLYLRNNIWYILLYYRYETNLFFKNNADKSKTKEWMNIERFVKEVLMGKYVLIKRIFSYLDKEFKTHITRDYEPLPTIIKSENYLKIATINRAISYDKNKKFQNSKVFLFDDLKDLEDDLSSYLLNEFTNHEYYVQNANRLIEAFNDRINRINPSKFFIFSFNYTNPFNVQKSNNEDLLLVHGSLETKDIIIGIDCNDVEKVENEDDNYRFSKAWRKINKQEETINIPPKNDIKNIIFFGHSLGEQDYSYFYSLFNYYDIYNSNTKLIFVYTNYEKTKEENDDNKHVYFDKIFALLRHYVTDSLGIKEANSFITKIQLENRLSIYELIREENDDNDEVLFKF